jgi:hypothetical protein
MKTVFGNSVKESVEDIFGFQINLLFIFRLDKQIKI